MLQDAYFGMDDECMESDVHNLTNMEIASGGLAPQNSISSQSYGAAASKTAGQKSGATKPTSSFN